MRAVVTLALAACLVSQAGVASEPEVGEFGLGATVGALLSEESARILSGVIPEGQRIQWAVYVPEGYDPAKPAGLMVYISPSDSGRIPSEWKPVMDRHNLIWIGAHDSGNSVSVSLRIAYAILAPAAVQRSYSIDAARVYLSGFSGGGRVSSMVATDYAELFKGAIYICGVNIWSGETPRGLAAMRSNRYVFLTGSKDFNMRDTKRAYEAYDRVGIPHIELMVIPRMSHRNPRRADFDEAIEFLDGRRAE